ncbi:hypothetical protein CEE45_10230 [Candidatus Heimdallarchaeota archaeon B3_Heim]|nr:MAG: hypothetical protein CEE45_10230 [Candidatus Heimdallarchaeota archaeon B3_Heim]
MTKKDIFKISAFGLLFFSSLIIFEVGLSYLELPVGYLRRNYVEGLDYLNKSLNFFILALVIFLLGVMLSI